MSERVVAVIPTYRPDPHHLSALVDVLRRAGIMLVISDDASPCTSDRLLRSLPTHGVTVVRHRSNQGIARSLNQGLAVALDVGAGWLLTVDQDSSIRDGYCDHLLAVAYASQDALGSSAVGAVAAGAIADASGDLGYPISVRAGVSTTDEVIQTGTLWNVAGMAAVGGFDEGLAMDAVDAAACLALRTHGMTIAVAPSARIGHRIGDGRQVRILGRNVMVSGHSPERRASILRNRLMLFPRELRQSPIHAFRTLRRVTVQTVLAVSLEEDRWAKAKGAVKGVLPSGNG